MTINIRGVMTLLQVFDMQRSVAFYRDILGFSVVSTSDSGEDYDWAMLKHGEAALMLNPAYESHERPAAADESRGAAHQDTILYFHCTDADEAHRRLLASGWDAKAPADTCYGMRQVYTRDPDGYGICFQHPLRSC